MAQVSSPPGLPAQAGTSTPVLKQYVHVPETKHERVLFIRIVEVYVLTFDSRLGGSRYPGPIPI